MTDLPFDIPSQRLDWPVTGPKTNESRAATIRTCFEKQILRPGHIIATVSLPDLLPKANLDLSPLNLTLRCTSCVILTEQITFAIMDDGMVYCLCHPSKGTTAIMTLQSALFAFGKPAKGTIVITPFQAKLLDTTWEVREFEIWRTSQKNGLVFPAYRWCLLFSRWLSVPGGMLLKLQVDEDGKHQPFSGTKEVCAQVTSFGIHNTMFQVTFSYEWEGTTRQDLVIILDEDEFQRLERHAM